MITLKIFADNRFARGVASEALRDLAVNVVTYITRRDRIDMGTPRPEATPFWLVRVATRYEGRAIKMRIDEIASRVYRETGRQLGCLVSGIPHDSPAQ
jgi:hypothetical protein